MTRAEPAISRDPRFSVITPSYNMLSYLRRCVSSVADQEISFEHIVVDARSRDGTGDWLRSDRDVVAIVEADAGMYDAVNKGIGRARGEFVSYLNCDEQYLPGALQTVARFFDAHPAVDLLFGDALLIDPTGVLLAYRKGYTPRWRYIAVSHLYVLSCTMFMRRRLLEAGSRFDTSWRDVGDAEFVIRLLRSGARSAHIGHYLAAFTMTGTNMSAAPNALAEARLLRASLPRMVRAMAVPLNMLRRATKVASGAYFQRFPLKYAVYENPTATKRREFVVESSTFRWPS